MDREQLINEIIKNFDFSKVAKVMEFLDWKWRDSEEPPRIGELVLHSQKQLSEAFDKSCENKSNIETGCGGFTVFAEYNKETEFCDFLGLSFVLTSWEAYEENN